MAIEALTQASEASIRPSAFAIGALDFVLRRQHCVFHAVPVLMNRNFGFNLSLWDRLFGTYRAAPRRAFAGMVVGLPNRRGEDAVAGALALTRHAVPARACPRSGSPRYA